MKSGTAAESLIDLLVAQAQNGTLSNLTIEDWEQLALSADIRAYEPDETILRQGDAGGALYIIAAGQVRVERDGKDGKTVELARLGRGAVVGEMSVLDTAPASANVVCAGEVELLKVDGTNLDQMIKADPAFGLRFYQSIATALSRRLRATNEFVRAAA